MKIKRGRLQQIIREELTRVLSEQADNDLDTDNDGKISVGELEQELQDIKDDLVKVDIVHVETGEVLSIGAGTQRGIPAAKILKFMGISSNDPRLAGDEPGITLSPTDFKNLEDHIDKVYDRPEREKAAAARKAEQERLNIDNLLQRLRDWAQTAADEWEADNPQGPSIQDVAFDLADAAEHSFEQDEWDELLWHFDDNKEALRSYTMDSMG